MIYRKSESIAVEDSRKGTFNGTLLEAFDDTKDNFFNVITADRITGLVTVWAPGDKVSCNRNLCKVKVRDLSR